MQADLDGPLVDYAAKGTKIELVGMKRSRNREPVYLQSHKRGGASGGEEVRGPGEGREGIVARDTLAASHEAKNEKGLLSSIVMWWKHNRPPTATAAFISTPSGIGVASTRRLLLNGRVGSYSLLAVKRI